jgi:hypothetical protein
LTADGSTAALDGYLERDPSRWSGFYPATRIELERRYRLLEGSGRATRGEHRTEYECLALARSDSPTPFLFFLSDEILAFIETDYWSLDEQECAGVLDALGPPPHRLDAAFRMDNIAGAEWVYPERGLALCVMPETGLIVRWAAFGPTTLQDYRKYIQPAGLAREFETETG